VIELFEGVGILFPNLLFQLVTFLLFVWVINRLLFKPIARALGERRERIASDLEKAAELREQARTEQDRFQAELREQQAEAQRMRQEMAARMAELEEQQMQAARDAAARIRAEAQQESERLREQALASAKGELAELVVQATTKVLGRAIDDEEQARLVDEAITEIGGGSN
jgi:F-type H+-transporting ATPase subunit b